MAKIKVKKPDIIKAIQSAHGLKTGVCELLGIARSTLDRYIEADPEIAEALAFAKVRPTDRAEYKLFEAIERGDSWAVMFRLKNAKDREYSERMDISGKVVSQTWKEFIESQDGIPSADNK